MPKRNRFARSNADAGLLPSSDAEIAFAPVWNSLSGYRARKLTSGPLTKLYLIRIERFDRRLRCVITLTRDLALELALNVVDERPPGF